MAEVTNRTGIARSSEDPKAVRQPHWRASTIPRSDHENAVNWNNSSVADQDSASPHPAKCTENFLVLCLSHDSDRSNRERDRLISQLRFMTQSIEIFTDADQCVDFLTDVVDIPVLMIIHDYFDASLITLLNELPQLHSIYIFSSDQLDGVDNSVKKVQGLFHQIEPMFDALKEAIYRLSILSTPVSIISNDSTVSPDQLDPSFMYTQLLKEIIVHIQYEPTRAQSEFITFCRHPSTSPDFKSQATETFEREYKADAAIWWYSKENFLYYNVNRALRTQDTEVLMKMGFFIQDLHRDIERRHALANHSAKLNVYRGQGLPQADFDQLQKGKGGLLAFNSFLSTSLHRDVSYMLAESKRDEVGMVGILFEIEIDPTISSTPFIFLGELSHFREEGEILFSMHTVCRIGEMMKIDDRLWHVKLTLTADNDPELKRLTDFVRNEIVCDDEWLRLAKLFTKMGKFDQALDIYGARLESMAGADEEALEEFREAIGSAIGVLYYSMGDYSTSSIHYRKSLEFWRQHLPPDHIALAHIYSNTALTQQAQGDYPNALSNCEKALEICQSTDRYDHPLLGTIYSSIGLIQQSMGRYPEALAAYQQGMETMQRTRPSNHPDLAQIYNNIAMLYQLLGEYSLALTYFEKALAIQQRSLPPDHLDLATVHNNIAASHHSLGNYSLALTQYHLVVSIIEKSCSPNHAILGVIHNNIGETYRLLGNHVDAISSFEKAMKIIERSLPPLHPNLARMHNNIAGIDYQLGRYASALSHFERTLEIQKKVFSSNHSDLLTTYNNIGQVHYAKGEYSSALSNTEKALKIQQESLPTDHPILATIYNNFALIYQSLGNYPVAFAYFRKTLQIQQRSLPAHHPDLARTQSNLASLKLLTQDFFSSISTTAQKLKSQQASSVLNHSVDTGIHQYSQHYAAGAADMQSLHEMLQKCQASDGSQVTINDQTTNEMSESMTALPRMLHHFEHALETQVQSDSSAASEGSAAVTSSALAILRQLQPISEKMQKMITNSQNQTSDDTDDDNDTSVEDILARVLGTCSELIGQQQRFHPPNDVSLATYHNTIGQWYCSIEDYRNAVVVFGKARDHLLQCVPVNHQLLAKTYDNVAMAFAALGRYREAIDSARQAVNSASIALGPNHSDSISYRNRFDQLSGHFDLD